MRRSEPPWRMRDWGLQPYAGCGVMEGRRSWARWPVRGSGERGFEGFRDGCARWIRGRVAWVLGWQGAVRWRLPMWPVGGARTAHRCLGGAGCIQ